MYKIFVDSDLDVTPKYAAKHDLGLLKMPFIINEKIYYPYSESDDFDFLGFYKALEKGIVPKTSALNMNEYIDAFEPVLKEGKDILYIHFSSAMSGTFQVLKNAKDELLEKYPDRRIETIDTLSITAGGLNIIEDLIKYKESHNSTIEELKAYSETIIQRYAIYFFATDLKFFKRSGRISNFAGFMGDIIGLKPVIYVSKEGVMTTLAKAHGIKQAISKIFEYMDKVGDEVEKHHIIIAHTAAFEAVELVRNKLKEKFGDNLDIEEILVNPTIGSHCGPNCLGISFFAKER